MKMDHLNMDNFFSLQKCFAWRSVRCQSSPFEEAFLKECLRKVTPQVLGRNSGHAI